MKNYLPALVFVLMMTALGSNTASAQRGNPAQGDGGSLSSPPGPTNLPQNTYQGYGQGVYGGAGLGYGNLANQGYYGIAGAQNNNGYYLGQPNAAGSYPPNYNTGVSPYNYNPYSYGSNYQNQNSNYSGYGYGGYGSSGYMDSPVNIYYGNGGYSNPGFGNGGYDNSSNRYFQRGSPYSRF